MTRIGGVMLIAGRPAAGHRAVGPVGGRPPRPGFGRLRGRTRYDALHLTTYTTGHRGRRRPRRSRRTPPSAPPALSPVELSRWAWRQLTSMRTALVLLFLLALAAVPGSVVPQQNIDAVKVANWQEAHPTADADLREARAVRRLRLGVVLGDLHPADGLAGRLHRAAAADLLAGDARRSRRACRGT